MKILLDLNVVLDLVLDRSPWVDDAKRLTERVLSGALQGYICATSIPTLFYVTRRTAGPARSLVAVQRCLSTFDVVPVTGDMLRQAAAMPGDDFEDNVQIAAAYGAGVAFIVTRDASGFRRSPIPVLTPAEYLAKNP